MLTKKSKVPQQQGGQGQLARFRFVGTISESGENLIIWIPKKFHDEVKSFKKKQIRITIDDEF